MGVTALSRVQPNAVWHRWRAGKSPCVRNPTTVATQHGGPGQPGAVSHVPYLFAARCGPCPSRAGVMHRKLTALSLRAQTLSSEPLGNDRYERVPLSFVGAGKSVSASSRQGCQGIRFTVQRHPTRFRCDALARRPFSCPRFANCRGGCADSKSRKAARPFPSPVGVSAADARGHSVRPRSLQ